MNKRKVPKIRFKGFHDDWEQRKLGDIIDFLDTLRKPLKETDREPGPYPYYGASGIVDYVADYIFDEELILLSEDGANITDRNYPVCFLATGKYWVNNHAHVLKARNKMDNNFICMSMERKDYSNYNTGMAMPKLNKDTCFQIPVACPAFEEQKKIGDYFRNLDNLITLHQRKLEKLKIIKKSMLENCFPKNGEKVPKIRFSGFSDDWEQRKLSSLCEKFTDGDWIESEDQSDSGVRLIQTGNVGVTEYLDKANNKKWISDETFDRLHCEEVLPGDILISRLPEPAGRACIMPFLGTKMITAVDCTIVRTSPDVSNKFFVQFLSSQPYFNEVNTCLAGGTRQRISRSNLANFMVPIPSEKDEQDAIGSVFESIDHLITLHQSKLEKLKMIKKSMLETMFV